MFDLEMLDLQDLFKIRDALLILARYDLHNKDLMYEVNKELQEREKPLPPDDPDKERDSKED